MTSPRSSSQGKSEATPSNRSPPRHAGEDPLHPCAVPRHTVRTSAHMSALVLGESPRTHLCVPSVHMCVASSAIHSILVGSRWIRSDSRGSRSSLPRDEAEQFDAFCNEQGFKKSTLIARLIREHLAQEGFAYQARLPLGLQ